VGWGPFKAGKSVPTLAPYTLDHRKSEKGDGKSRRAGVLYGRDRWNLGGQDNALRESRASNRSHKNNGGGGGKRGHGGHNEMSTS